MRQPCTWHGACARFPVCRIRVSDLPPSRKERHPFMPTSLTLRIGGQVKQSLTPFPKTVVHCPAQSQQILVPNYCNSFFTSNTLLGARLPTSGLKGGDVWANNSAWPLSRRLHNSQSLNMAKGVQTTHPRKPILSSSQRRAQTRPA